MNMLQQRPLHYLRLQTHHTELLQGAQGGLLDKSRHLQDHPRHLCLLEGVDPKM